MKKLLYLFIASAILISCGSDNEDTDLDPIIGTWQLQSVIEDGQEQTTACELKTTIFFLANGTTTGNSYFDDGNGCVSETDTSNWINLGNSTYRIDSDDQDVKLNFSQNNTVFSATISETYNNTTYTTTITYRKI